MSGKLRKMLAVLCAAAMLLSTGAMPAMADETEGLQIATPTEATQPMSDVKVVLEGMNNLKVTGKCEPGVEVRVTLCDAEGNAIIGEFNPHVVKGSATTNGTFETTFTNLVDGVYRLKAVYKKSGLQAVYAIAPDNTDRIAIATQPTVTDQPVTPEKTQEPAPPAAPISGVQAALSGTKDIAVTGFGEAGQSVVIQIFKGNEATDLTHTELVGADGVFRTTFTDMNPNDYRACAYYKTTPDSTVFANEVVTVPSSDRPALLSDATGGDVVPGTPQATNITSSEATISGTGSDGQKVQISLSTGVSETVSVSSGSYSHTFTGLTPETEYTATVQYEGGTNTESVTFKTTSTQPPAPAATIEIDSLTGGEEVVTVSGKATVGNKVYVVVTIDGQDYEVKGIDVESDGSFSATVSVPGKAGTVNAGIWAEIVGNPNVYDQKTLQATITAKPVNLTVSASYDANDKKVKISGTGKPGAAITIKVGSKASFSGQVDSQGNYALSEYVEGEGNDMQVVVSYVNAGIGSNATDTVDIPAPPKTVDINILTATGGVKQIVLAGTGKPGAIVEATVGGVTAQATVDANGGFSLTLSGVPKGDYKDIVVKYTDANNGNAKTWNGAVTVTEPVVATDISITTVKPEVGKVTIIGTAKAGERVVASMVTPENKTVTRGIAADANGSYTIAFDNLVSGTYKTLVIQYVNDGVGKQAAYPGDIVVPAPSVDKPTIQVDKIYTDTLVVVGKTTPNLKVTVSTSYGNTQYSYSQNSGSDGVFRIPLTRTQSVGAKVRVTVTYGNNETVYTDVEVEKTTQKPTYLTLSRYKGSRGQVVLDLQRRLSSLGYTVQETARFDYATEEAVRQFQRTNGLDVDGIAGKNTQTLLYSVSAKPNGSPSPDRYPVLVRGDRGNAVTRLQQRLKDLGYYTIKVDGIYGVGTQSAVRAFQRRNSLTQTGTADNYTQQVLFSSAALAMDDYDTNYVYLSRGSRGSAVTRLQSRLAALGYYYGSLDGIYGSATQTAVRRFQSRNGIRSTGNADVNTQVSLFSSSAISNGSSSGSSVGYVYLHYGSRGTAVTRLQQALKDKGYLKGKVDGIYGDQTYDAVKAFQRAKGLSVDGIAGRKTQNALYGTNY